MRPYSTVLLDADMTLLDFQRSEQAALSRVLSSHGLPCGQDVLDTYSKINSTLWKALARGAVDQDFLVVERFAALQRVIGGREDPRQLNAHYSRALGEEAHLLPGALDFCKRLRQAGLTLAIATNGLPSAQWGRYRRTGLDQVIPHLFVSMEIGAQKPIPAYFDRVLDQLGVSDRSQVLMVGDGLETDILGGNRANIHTVWYNPQGAPLSGPARPTYIAANYEDICAILLPSDGLPQRS